MVTEWNYGLMEPMPPPLQRASFITAALIYMQDAPIVWENRHCPRGFDRAFDIRSCDFLLLQRDHPS